MDTIAIAIAKKIKAASPENTASIAVMAYSLTIISNTLFVFACSLIIGFLLGLLSETVLSLVAFMVSRFFSGGRHFKSSIACNVVSIAICVLIPLIADQISHSIMIGVTIVNIIIMSLCAPMPDTRAQLPKRLYPYFKVISVIGAGANLFIDSQVIALCFFAQAITIIPLGRRGTK